MQAQELYFVIPTYRLRDVGETVEQYDRHFWKNGRTVKIVVFDDSIPANQQKYFPLLEQTRPLAAHVDIAIIGVAQVAVATSL